MKFVPIALAFSTLMCSCKEEDEDRMQEIDKTGAVESSIKVAHLNDSVDVITTRHVVWKNNAELKSLVKHDTIPNLGNTTVKDDKDIPQVIKKDYEIYITVKE